MRACEDKKIHLERFFRGNLDKENRDSLKSHLVRCDRCRRALRTTLMLAAL